MDIQNLNKLTTNLLSFDQKTFTGAKLTHSIKLCSYLYKHANGVTNIVNILNKDLEKNFFKSPRYLNLCLTKLKEFGVIQSLSGYTVGKSPKGYRLSNDYLPVEKQSIYKIEQLMMGKEFLSKDGVNIDEDTFFNTKPGPEGFVKMFGEPVEEPIQEKEIIDFKGFKKVEIDKVSPEDISLFKTKINQLKEQGIEPSESILYDLKLWSVEKTWYIYHKWRTKVGYNHQ
jgi:hypothetical protein